MQFADDGFRYTFHFQVETFHSKGGESVMPRGLQCPYFDWYDKTCRECEHDKKYQPEEDGWVSCKDIGETESVSDYCPKMKGGDD